MSAPASLSSRFAQAIGALGRLQKDKRNDHARYDYLSEEAVKAAVGKVVAEHDLAPSSITFEILLDEYRAAKQGEQNIVKVRAVLEWDGARCEGLGCGIDYGDKAILKAQTSAIREAWKNRFIIATGHDPEADIETDKAGPTQAAPRRSSKVDSKRGEFIAAVQARAAEFEGVQDREIARSILDRIGAKDSGSIPPKMLDDAIDMARNWEPPVGEAA